MLVLGEGEGHQQQAGVEALVGGEGEAGGAQHAAAPHQRQEAGGQQQVGPHRGCQRRAARHRVRVEEVGEGEHPRQPRRAAQAHQQTLGLGVAAARRHGRVLGQQGLAGHRLPDLVEERGRDEVRGYEHPGDGVRVTAEHGEHGQGQRGLVEHNAGIRRQSCRQGGQHRC